MNVSKRRPVLLNWAYWALFFFSGVFVCSFYQLTVSANLYKPLPTPQTAKMFNATVATGIEEAIVESQEMEEMFITTHSKASTGTQFPSAPAANQTQEMTPETPTQPPAPPLTTVAPASGKASHLNDEYPKDFFTIEDRRRGWVILHVVGTSYMFIALVIVCNEFFVPAVGVITNKLAISDDVAGATFMATGRATPKFFALFIGVIISQINVGIGTIVGPAVFNILFVIGMCAIFSREVLHLTWWPLFRDVSFYILDLIMLIIFFLDNVIMWWESMMLVTGYSLYVIFMKFNVQAEHSFKAQLCKHKNITLEEPEKAVVRVGEEGPGGCEDAESDISGRAYSDKLEGDQTEDKEEKEEEKHKREEKNKPLTLEWPDTGQKQAAYLFLLPIILPLWLTVPDVRKPKSRKFFVITFLGSVLWIAVFLYFLMWWAHQVGDTFGIPGEVMTILAAVISNPVLITNVIVARKGMADMAVSSCVGNNIFDITVGLPVPWLLYSFIHGLAPVPVRSNGLICAIVLLFIMLLFVIISIASCKWKMNKALGFTLLLLYLIFLLLSVMLEYRIIVCPI